MLTLFHKKSVFHLEIAVFILLLATGVKADPLDDWHWRNPMPPAKNLSGVTCGNGKFVAVGEFGTIYTSTDGATWNFGSAGNLAGLWDVAYGNGIFVAVGNLGKIMTSSDGVAWVERASAIGGDIFGITYGRGMFTAVGGSGVILTSPDGKAWEGRYVNGVNFLSDVAYGNGTFVAVGYYFDEDTWDSRVFASRDGVEWERVSSVTRNAITGVAYGNGVFVASGAFGTIITSSDGFSWKFVDPKTYTDLNNVTYGSGSFVAVGNGIALTSVDGVEWQMTGVGANLFGVTFGNNEYVAVGENCAIFVSNDGITWTGETRPGLFRYTFQEVIHGNGTFVAIGGTPYGTSALITSNDGRTWVEQSTGSQPVYRVAYGNGTFVTVDAYVGILSSVDGVVWTRRDSGAEKKHLMDVAYGNGMFIAVGGYVYGGGDVILTSSDGITWSEQKWGTDYRLNYLSYANGIFVIGCNRVNLFGDGVTWAVRERKSSPSDIVYGNGIFVGRGYGKFWTSSDGVNWKAGISTEPFYMYSLDFGGNAFVAVGRLGDQGKVGAIMTSTDGVKWTVRFLEEFVPLNSVAFGNGTFVAVGENGIILQSDHVVGPRVSINSLAADFGNVRLGSAPEQIISVRNDGTENLILGAIAEPSPPFRIISDTCSNQNLIPGESCSMTVRFDSPVVGAFNSGLQIDSNDPDRSRVTIPIRGTIVAPDLTGTWTSLVQSGTSKVKIKGVINIENIGSPSAPSTFVKFYISDDAKYDPGVDTFLKQVATGTLGPGASKARKLSYRLPVGETASGKYVIAVIDAEDAVMENNETNNEVVFGPIP